MELLCQIMSKPQVVITCTVKNDKRNIKTSETNNILKDYIHPSIHSLCSLSGIWILTFYMIAKASSSQTSPVMSPFGSPPHPGEAGSKKGSKLNFSESSAGKLE